MLELLKKDIIFTKKWIVMSVIYAIVVAYIIMAEGATNIIFTHCLIPFFVTSLPFTKIMSMEDNQDTRDFLRRLPVNKYKVVFARTLFLILLLVISSISLGTIQVVGFKVNFDYDLIINLAIVLLGFLAYFLIQLGVFYKYSYHAAQTLLVEMSIIAIVIAFATERINVNIEICTISRELVLLIMVIINGVIFAIDGKLYEFN